MTPERVVRVRLPRDVRAESLLIYDLEGELFFGAAPELERYLAQIRDETVRSSIRYVVLRLRRTRNPDVVAIEHLEHFLRDADKRGVTVLLAGLRPEFTKVLENARFKDWLPADRLFPEENEVYSATLRAVRHAYRLLGKTVSGNDLPLAAEDPAYREVEEASYYLV